MRLAAQQEDVKAYNGLLLKTNCTVFTHYDKLYRTAETLQKKFSKNAGSNLIYISHPSRLSHLSHFSHFSPLS